MNENGNREIPDKSSPDRLTRAPTDRRMAVRFPLDLEVQYCIAGNHSERAGSGRVINISSSGILFATSTQVPVGSRIRLSVSWPVRLSQTCGLMLWLNGKVVRSGEGFVAVKIATAEFRTRSSKSPG